MHNEDYIRAAGYIIKSNNKKTDKGMDLCRDVSHDKFVHVMEEKNSKYSGLLTSNGTLLRARHKQSIQKYATDIQKGHFQRTELWIHFFQDYEKG